MQSKTYVSATAENSDQLRSATTAARTSNDLRSVMMSTKNEELAEENENKARSRS